MRSLSSILFLIAIATFSSCSKEVEIYESEPVADYYPLQVGKSITYRLDSTVFTNFGQNTVIRSYQEKNVVDAQVTDASGRISYRIHRFIRDLAGTEPWQPSSTYYVTPTDKSVEVVENNLRIIKLVLPIKKGFSWHGNKYLSSKPYESLGTSLDVGIQDWIFNYDSLNYQITLLGKTYDNVLKVKGIDNILVPDTIRVNSENNIVIPKASKSVYLTGNATAQITINAEPLTTSSNEKLFIYNRSNQTAKLNVITIPSGAGRSFEFTNNQWAMSGGKDTLFYDLPYGFKLYQVEEYSKNIGLITQEFKMWEFQPNSSGANSYHLGFEVKRTIISNN